ncbi:MAG TPA: AAA family ATPase [Tepidisphaeraceae bacterium]|jgi:predicted ATPase|nr:AAA family ATPase [Tepidisphaeraceae bacterium]
MIEHIRIQNFKSIHDVSVDLSPVTVLIGRSGVGKSNFLRAIRFLRNYLRDANAAVQIEGGWERIFPFGTRADVSISVRFAIPGYDAKFHYEVTWKPHPQSPSHALPGTERLRLGDNTIFGRSAAGWEAWPDARPRPQPQFKIYLSAFPTVSEAVLAFTALTSGIGWHDFPADVFRASTKAENSQDKGLDDSAGNYLQVLRDLTQNLQSQHARRQILARIRQVNPSVASLEIDSILQPKKVVVAHKVNEQLIPLDLSQESDGFRRYYAHLLALYQSPPKQLLMFEEPENGIYPGALLNLAEEFSTAAKNGRGQVLLTTQSPDLLDGFEPEQLRVVEVDQAQSTKVGPLDQGQLQAVKDKLLEPGELITVDQARQAGAST